MSRLHADDLRTCPRVWFNAIDDKLEATRDASEGRATDLDLVFAELLPGKPLTQARAQALVDEYTKHDMAVTWLDANEPLRGLHFDWRVRGAPAPVPAAPVPVPVPAAPAPAAPRPMPVPVPVNRPDAPRAPANPDVLARPLHWHALVAPEATAFLVQPMHAPAPVKALGAPLAPAEPAEALTDPALEPVAADDLAVARVDAWRLKTGQPEFHAIYSDRTSEWTNWTRLCQWSPEEADWVAYAAFLRFLKRTPEALRAVERAAQRAGHTTAIFETPSRAVLMRGKPAYCTWNHSSGRLPCGAPAILWTTNGRKVSAICAKHICRTCKKRIGDHAGGLCRKCRLSSLETPKRRREDVADDDSDEETADMPMPPAKRLRTA
jgi:hypothetical protein